MRFPWVFLALLALLSCAEEKVSLEVDRDLGTIQTDTLRVGIAHGPFSLRRERKRDKGLEFLLLSDLAEERSIPIKFIVVHEVDSAVNMLRKGSLDVLAGGLSAATTNKLGLTASCSFNTANTLTVRHRPDPWYGRYWGHRGYPAVKGAEYPEPDTLYVSKWQQIPEDQLRGKQVIIQDESPIRTLEKVAMGSLPHITLSSTFATTHAKLFPHLSMDQSLHPNIDLVFALRNTSTALNAEINAYLGNTESWAKTDVLVGVHASPDMRRSTGAFSHPHHSKQYISAFDKHFVEAANETGLDWRFLTALAFKESRFDTSAASHMGALGIMQLLPSTAESLGIDSMPGVRGQIMASARYLKQLGSMFRKSVPDKSERLGFILASYNAGVAHVLDAQRLASQEGLDPSKWKGNTERALLLLSSPEHYRKTPAKHGYCKGYSVFLFVREVLHYHDHYKSLKMNPA